MTNLITVYTVIAGREETRPMTTATKKILAQARYIRDYDAAAAKKFPEAAAIIKRVSRRIEARYERSR
jgi:hypothetical protein